METGCVLVVILGLVAVFVSVAIKRGKASDSPDQPRPTRKQPSPRPPSTSKGSSGSSYRVHCCDKNFDPLPELDQWFDDQGEAKKCVAECKKNLAVHQIDMVWKDRSGGLVSKTWNREVYRGKGLSWSTYETK